MNSLQPEQKEEKHRRRLRGVVVSTAAAKTATVRVDRIFRHPQLQRVVRRWRKFLAHDAEGAARLGDLVVIEETRPLSKRKRWRVVEIVKSEGESGAGEGEESANRESVNSEPPTNERIR